MMSYVLIIPVALLMIWAVWKFVSGFWTIEPEERDMETGSRSDGTWLS